jgi:hypothetical protein
MPAFPTWNQMQAYSGIISNWIFIAPAGEDKPSPLPIFGSSPHFVEEIFIVESSAASILMMPSLCRDARTSPEAGLDRKRKKLS